jgi:hypothetical protein
MPLEPVKPCGHVLSNWNFMEEMNHDIPITWSPVLFDGPGDGFMFHNL